MGILRSVGALARAMGPVVCSSGKEGQTHASIYLRNHYLKMSYLTCFMELNAQQSCLSIILKKKC